jgi:hypothetical protein
MGSSNSPVRVLESRYKRIFALSRSSSMQLAEMLCEYKNRADDFLRLENETQIAETELGRRWAERAKDRKLETSSQARANFMMQAVYESMHPKKSTKKGRKERLVVLREMREYARNIDMMIDVFSWGAVPLLAKAPWKQVYCKCTITSLKSPTNHYPLGWPTLAQPLPAHAFRSLSTQD